MMQFLFLSLSEKTIISEVSKYGKVYPVKTSFKEPSAEKSKNIDALTEEVNEPEAPKYGKVYTSKKSLLNQSVDKIQGDVDEICKKYLQNIMDASKNVTVLSVVKIPPVNLVKEVEKHLTLNKENKQVVSLEKPALEKAKLEKLNENEDKPKSERKRVRRLNVPPGKSVSAEKVEMYLTNEYEYEYEDEIEKQNENKDKPKPERKRARRLNVPPGKSVSAKEVDMYLTNEYEDEIEQPNDNKENSTQVELQKKRINRSNLPRKCELAKDTESLSTKEDQDRAKEHNENITQCEYECVKLRNLLLGQKIPEDVEIDLTNEEEDDNYVTPPRDLTSLEEVNMNLLEELNKKKINCPRSLSEEGENNKKCQLPVIRAIRFELPPGKSVSAKDVEVILKNKEDELKNKYYHTTKH